MLRITSGVRRPVLVALVLATTAGCGGSANHAGSPVEAGFPSFDRAARVPEPRLHGNPLVSLPRAAAGAVAVDAAHLVWESGRIESDQFEPSLYERSLPQGTATRLAVDVNPQDGLASTRRWVVFGRTRGGDQQVLAVDHGGGRSRLLASGLIAPVASRGDVVAWAVQQGDRQRVVAMDTGHGRTFVVANLPRCDRSGCYRIEAVTVAASGVVFTRGAVGSQSSFVMRRAFPTGSRMTALEAAAVPSDPQPDLVPSSAGALYYVLARGWYRWSFGERRPVAVQLPRSPSIAGVLGMQNDRVYLLMKRGCRYTLRWVPAPGGPAGVTGAARAVRGTTGCVQLGGVAWTPSHVLTAWSIVPAASEAAHRDTGLHGVILDSSVPLGLGS
jgi:hypothetical protein